MITLRLLLDQQTQTTHCSVDIMHAVSNNIANCVMIPVIEQVNVRSHAEGRIHGHTQSAVCRGRTAAGGSIANASSIDCITTTSSSSNSTLSNLRDAVAAIGVHYVAPWLPPMRGMHYVNL